VQVNGTRGGATSFGAHGYRILDGRGECCIRYTGIPNPTLSVLTVINTRGERVRGVSVRLSRHGSNFLILRE
jgi:hypothetical protein